MKKWWITWCFLMAGIAVSAQSKTYEVGGMFGFWHDSNGHETTFDLNPDFSCNLSDSLGVGLMLEYSHVKHDAGKVNRYGVRPYVTWTFFSKGDLSFYVDTLAGWSFIRPSEGKHGHMAEAGFEPGVSYALSDRINVQASVGFLGYRHVDSGFSDYWKDGWGFQLDGNTLEFGITYVL